MNLNYHHDYSKFSIQNSKLTMTATEFIVGLADKVDPAVLEGVETNFHFDISGEGGGQYTAEVCDGNLEISEGLNGEPKCVVKTSNDTLIGVVTKKTNPMMAVLMGKIKISNQGELLKYAKVFGIM